MRLWILASLFAVGVACSPAAQGPAASQEGPKYGGVLRYRTNTSINDYDPTIALKSKSTFYTDTVYESLLSFKAGPEVDYSQLIIEPKLAERWEVSPDGRQFTFHLR